MNYLIITPCVYSQVREYAGQIIKKCYEAHGGIYTTDSLKIAYTFSTSTRRNELQSLVPFAPFETYKTIEHVWVDKITKKEFYKSYNTSPGFVYNTKSFIDNGKGYNVDLTLKMYEPVTSLPNPRHLFYHYILESGSKDTSKLKFIDKEIINGKRAYHLLLDTIDIYINEKDFLLARLERPVYDPVFVKGIQTFDFSNYVRAGKIMVPQKYSARRITKLYGTITNNYTISKVRSEFEIPASEFSVPQGYSLRQSNSRYGEIQKLGDGLYFMENINGPGGPYHAIIAEFSNFILITEAPLDNSVSKHVIQKAKEIIPNKPIRYLVQSHHHNDHIGGALSYVEEGATIITTKDAALLINEMSKNSSGSINNSFHLPKTQPVYKRWSMTDVSNECIVFNIGPTPHSRQILITWFPKQGVLFQADVPVEQPLQITTADFVKKIKALNLNVKTLVCAHDKLLRETEIK